MNNKYTRRSILAGTAAFAGTGLSGCNEKKTADSDAGADSEKPPAPGTASNDADAIKTRTASCNCGQLRVTCVGPDPERISLCHCNLCQKQSGSAFAIQARFPTEQVTIEGESKVWSFPEAGVEPVEYRNCASEGAKYHFCATCGSTVYYTADTDPARIGVKIGAFTDPSFPAPKISGFEAYRHPWAMSVDKLTMEHLD